MPTYFCSAAAGRLTSAQKADIVNSITTIHHEETGAARYLVLLSSRTSYRPIASLATDRRLRIRSGFEAISEADEPTSRRARCSDG